MKSTLKKFAIVGVSMAVALTGAVLFAQNTGNADEAMVVGTYDPQAVAMQSGLQQKMQAEMGGLQQRMQTAQQEGDQAAMQEIQSEAGQIQERIVGEFESDLDGVMPGVAEEVGVKIIAVEVSYTADEVETKDVTDALIAELNGGEMPQQELSIPGLPQSPQ